MQPDLAVCMTGISKRFGAVQANDRVNLSVRRGTALWGKTVPVKAH